jgi:hypothetical protein
VTDPADDGHPPYAKWLRSGGAEGKEPFKEIKELWDYFVQGVGATDAHRIEIGKKMFQLHADQVLSIGVVGQGLIIYGIHLAKANVENVPGRYVNSTVLRTPRQRTAGDLLLRVAVAPPRATLHPIRPARAAFRPGLGRVVRRPWRSADPRRSWSPDATRRRPGRRGGDTARR